MKVLLKDTISVFAGRRAAGKTRGAGPGEKIGFGPATVSPGASHAEQAGYATFARPRMRCCTIPPPRLTLRR